MMTQTLTLVMLLVTFVVIGACITENLSAKQLTAHLSLFYLMPTFIAVIAISIICIALAVVYAIAECIVDGIYKVLDLFRKPSTT